MKLLMRCAPVAYTGCLQEESTVANSATVQEEGNRRVEGTMPEGSYL
jgi:hypothetical protein